MILQKVFRFSCVCLMALLGFAWPGIAGELPEKLAPMNLGAHLFTVHCAGCHPGGGNIIRRGKTLKLKALQRNGRDSQEAITELVNNGKGNMSAFKERLTVPEIEAVVTYVLEQAQQDWRS